MVPGDCHQILREHGLAPSVPRVAVYTWLMEHPIHPTVDEIYTHLRPKLLTLSRATVYNVLRALVASGLVQKIYAEDLELRYDANVASHAHFKCHVCGKIYDLGDIPEGLNSQLSLPDGFQMNSLAVTLWGCCPECQPTACAALN